MTITIAGMLLYSCHISLLSIIVLYVELFFDIITKTEVKFKFYRYLMQVSMDCTHDAHIYNIYLYRGVEAMIFLLQVACAGEHFHIHLNEYYIFHDNFINYFLQIYPCKYIVSLHYK